MWLLRACLGALRFAPARPSALCSGVLSRGLAFCNRARRGLFAGRGVNFGNNVSFSKRRTRMRQLPNVQSSSFFSKTLGRVLKFRATTHAIRCIDKAGDIDHWLLKSPNSLILNPQAIALKKKIRRIKAKTSPADVAISSASA